MKNRTLFFEYISDYLNVYCLKHQDTRKRSV